MAKVMDGLNSSPWIALGKRALDMLEQVNALERRLLQQVDDTSPGAEERREDIEDVCRQMRVAARNLP